MSVVNESPKMSGMVTCVAPVNIAVIKYWGKRDNKLILPLNDSISATLCLDHMSATTTVQASPLFKEDKLWLNGVEEQLGNGRLNNCLKEIRRRSRALNEGSEEMSDWHVHICSENNFPTAAGLASSAAGYACLVYALAKLFKVKGDISSIARQGSGSACRSVYGGFVRWHKGDAADGTDSIARQIAPVDHWPEMRVMILVVSDQKKFTSSSSGMEQSILTSELLKYRVEKCVPERVVAMEKAILERDFQTFAEITMKESNQFHAVCLDTYPPASYMKDISHQISSVVHSYNAYHGHLKVAYTFDAGPNACLYLLEPEVAHVSALMSYIFPPRAGTGVEYHRGSPPEPVPLSEDLKLKIKLGPQEPGKLMHILHTRVGDGPRVVEDPKQHLLNEAGLAKNLCHAPV